jgi:hypothetical protein
MLPNFSLMVCIRRLHKSGLGILQSRRRWTYIHTSRKRCRAMPLPGLMWPFGGVGDHSGDHFWILNLNGTEFFR